MKGSPFRVAVIRSLLILAVFMIFSGWAAELLALTDEEDDLTMGGIQGISVVVATANPDAQHSILKKEEIQTDIEKRLRKSGIRILSDEEIGKRGFPYLNVVINVTNDKAPNVYGYNIKAELYKQFVMNKDDAKEFMGFALYNSDQVWSSEKNGTAPADHLKDNVQKQMDEILDKFISDFLAANPKTGDKP